MQIFELYFNPEKSGRISESFIHQPQNVYERKLGKLYMVGEMLEMSKSDSPFLQNIFHIAKERYYENTSLSPDKALSETLKEVNSFLKNKEYQGKLFIAFLCSKNFSIHIAKIGEVKVVLLSEGKIKDICQELSKNEGDVFQDIISGEMKKKDKLLILTPEIYDSFKKGNLFQEIMKAPLNEKVMDKISALQKEKFPEASGVSLVMDHSLVLKEESQKISDKKTKKFSFPSFFKGIASSFSKIKRPKISLPQIKVPSIDRKPLSLFLLLFAVIIIGYLVISVENNIRIGRQKEIISQIDEDITRGKEKEDILLLKKSLSELEKLKEKRTQLHQQIEERYISLENELLALSGWEEVKDIELIKKVEEINPEGILITNEVLYFFTSKSPEILSLNLKTGKEHSYSLPSGEGVDLSSSSLNRSMFFASPNYLFSLENETPSISEIAKDDHSYISLSSFLGVPYFLKNNGEIFSYRNKYPGTWIEKGEKRIENALQLAIDGSIFILDKDNKIHRYYRGKYEEEINYLVFPSFRANKMETFSDTPVFFLDSKEKRIIIANKEGDVKRQLYIPGMQNPKDIAISSDQEKIYLLDGQEVYSIEF